MEHGVDPEAIRSRAYELSQARAGATEEENWLLAEAELAAEATKAEQEAKEAAAAFMANAELRIYGHS